MPVAAEGVKFSIATPSFFRTTALNQVRIDQMVILTICGQIQKEFMLSLGGCLRVHVYFRD